MADDMTDPLLAQFTAALTQDNDQTEAARPVPHALEIERDVLGALMLNNDSVDRVSATLEARHFYAPLHGRIYDAIRRLHGEGRSADPKSVGVFMASDEALQHEGGTQYLKALVEGSPTVVIVADHARTLVELATRRELIRVGEDIIEQAVRSDTGDSPQTQIEAAERALYGLSEQGRYGRGFVTLKDAVGHALETANRAFQNRSATTGVTTGLRRIDMKLGGLQKSDLVILAGRPGMGKTALATNIAVNAARARIRNPAEGAGVAFFSLEMSAEQLALRILSEFAQVASERIRRGKIDGTEFGALADASQLLEGLPLRIDDGAGLSIAQIAARSRRLKREKAFGLGLIVVDYLQLVEASGTRRTDNRVQEVSEVTKGLKNIAKELDVPVLALSQLSRGVDARDDKRPVLSDLRESGSIEQDADVVMFVYREEYYLRTREPDAQAEPKAHLDWHEKLKRVEGRADVLIEKHRHGPTGKVELAFQAQFTRFDNLSEDQDVPFT